MSSSASFTATIPSTANNPFIKQTSLPEGTLFIAVGSILLGIVVFLGVWRVYAIWAARKAATFNEAKFTSLEPSYGGPFKDPVGRTAQDSDDEENELGGAEKGPELHPIGVPLNPRSKRRSRKPRPKSQADRVREAQLQGKFFSPTAEVLLHGTSLPSVMGPPGTSGMTSGSSILPYASSISSGYPAQSSRLSILHSGRNSIVQHSAMSMSSDGQFYQPPQGPYTGPPDSPNPYQSFIQGGSTGPPTGTGDGVDSVSQQRPRKMRPPSAFLDDLVG